MAHLKGKPPDPNRLVDVHTRFFADSIDELKRRAEAAGIPWQIELRLLIRRALAGERREIRVLTERSE